jgi:transposase
MLTRWNAFTRFFDDRRICLTNDRKSWVFAGSDRGGDCAAANVDPQAGSPRHGK